MKTKLNFKDIWPRFHLTLYRYLFGYSALEQTNIAQSINIVIYIVLLSHRLRNFCFDHDFKLKGL